MRTLEKNRYQKLQWKEETACISCIRSSQWWCSELLALQRLSGKRRSLRSGVSSHGDLWRPANLDRLRQRHFHCQTNRHNFFCYLSSALRLLLACTGWLTLCANQGRCFVTSCQASWWPSWWQCCWQASWRARWTRTTKYTDSHAEVTISIS